MYFHASWSLWTIYDSHKLSLVKKNIWWKRNYFSSALHYMPLEDQLLDTYGALVKMKTLSRWLCSQLLSMLLIMGVTSLLIEMKMIPSWWSQTWALWQYGTYRNGWPPSPQSLDRSNDAEEDYPSQTTWEAPWDQLSNHKQVFIHFSTKVLLESFAVCRLTWMSLIKHRIKVSAKLVKLHAIILALEDILRPAIGPICTFLQTLWPLSMFWPSGLTNGNNFFIQGCPFGVEISGNLLPHRYPKYQSKSHI